MKRNKYHNKKTIYNGIKFDSLKERNYYMILKNYEKNGRIRDLKTQVPFELIPTYKINGKTVRKTQYYADFTYVSTNDNKIHVVDTKGVRTQVYKIKKKMFEYKYKLEIEEIC